MHIDRNHSHWFHGVVANTKQREHEIDLLNSYRIIFICVKDGDGSDNEDRKHEKCNVVVCHVAVEDIVVMIFFNKKIVIFLDQDIFPADQFGLSEAIE